MKRYVLPVILAVYVLLAISYSIVTPLWEAPDEPSHYRYIEYLAMHGTLPPPAPPQRGYFWQYGYATSLYEWYQPPLYYALLAPVIAVIEVLQPETMPHAFPSINPAFQKGARNVFAPIPDRSLQSVFTAPGPRIARLVSVLLGLLTLVATYRLALIITNGDEPTALTATGFMAFIPQFTFLTGYISNDNLVHLLSTLCILAYVQWLRYTPVLSTRQIVGAGLLVALALLTKLSLLFVLPLGLLCLLWRLVRHRSVQWWAWESGLFAGVALSLPLGSWLWLPGFRAQMEHAWVRLQIKPARVSLDAIGNLWPLTHTSFWGRFGWMNVATPAWIPTTLTLIACLGLLGSVALVWPGTRHAQETKVSRQALALLWAVCLLVVLGFIRFNVSYVGQAQGRFLFPALSACVILVVLGLFHLGGARRRWMVGFGLVSVTLIINVVSLVGTLLPAYSSATS